MIKKLFFSKKLLIFCLLIFVFSRLIVSLYFKINLSDVYYGYHLMSQDLLHKDLLKSLYYLHFQPYLWNLFNGIILKVFNGDVVKVSIFFSFYHKILTLVSIIFFYNMLKLFNISNFNKLIILLFITLSPTIIFYENIFSYAHTTFFIFNIFVFLLTNFFFKKKRNKYEVGIYFCLFILGNIWVLFNVFILIPLAFIIARIYKKNNFKVSFVALILIFISFLPILKNKIVFDEFVYNTKSGQDFGTVFYDWQKFCNHPIKDKQKYINLYFKKHENKKFYHDSLIGSNAGFNHIGMIIFGKNCFKLTIKRIKKDPLDYLEGRAMAFLASHGKFGFDYVYPVPTNWNNYYSKITNIYKDKNYKLYRQILIFFIMILIYAKIVKLILNSNIDKKIRNSCKCVFLLYVYILVIGTFAAGTEQERILYTGFGLYVFFLLSFFIKKVN